VTAHPRYGRLRLDGDPDEFHRALAYLAADTCDKGRCDPDGMCGRHQQRANRRRLRAVPDLEAS
jgi:hypothetical protein